MLVPTTVSSMKIVKAPGLSKSLGEKKVVFGKWGDVGKVVSFGSFFEKWFIFGKVVYFGLCFFFLKSALGYSWWV